MAFRRKRPQLNLDFVIEPNPSSSGTKNTARSDTSTPEMRNSTSNITMSLVGLGFMGLCGSLGAFMWLVVLLFSTPFYLSTSLTTSLTTSFSHLPPTCSQVHDTVPTLPTVPTITTITTILTLTLHTITSHHRPHK
jgi:hypothetical protein